MSEIDLSKFSKDELIAGFDAINEQARREGLPAFNPIAKIPTNLPPKDKKVKKDLEGVTFKDDPFSFTLSLAEEGNLFDELKVQIENQMRQDSDRNQNIKKWNKIYNQEKDSKNFPWPEASNVTTGFAAAQVDTAVAKFDKALLEAKPVILVNPTEDADYNTAKKQQDFLHWHNSVREDVSMLFRDAYRNACIDGNAIIKVLWDRKTETRRENSHYETIEELERDFIDIKQVQKDFPQFFRRLRSGRPIDVQVEFEDEIRNHPVGKIVLLENIYTDAMDDLEEANFIAEEIEIPFSKLEDRWDDGWYTPESKERFIESINEEDKEFRYENHKIYEVIWRGKIGKDKKPKKYIITLSLEKNTILRMENFPYNHGQNYYINVRIANKKKNWLGYSLIEIIENPNEVMESVLNQKIDNNTLANAPIILEKLYSNVEERDYKVVPGQRWPVRNFDDFTILKFPSPDLSNDSLEITLKNAMEGRTAFTPASQGKESAIDPNAPGNKTIALLNESLIRIDLYIKNLRPSLARYAFLTLQLYHEFAPQGLDFRVLNPEDQESLFDELITSDELRLKADYNPRPQTSFSNQQTESIILFQYYQLMLSDPALQSLDPQRREVLRRWLKTQNVTGINQILPTEQEFLNYQVQVQTQALIQAQQQQEALEAQEQQKLLDMAQEQEAHSQFEDELRNEGAEEALLGKEIEDKEDEQAGVEEGRALNELMKGLIE